MSFSLVFYSFSSQDQGWNLFLPVEAQLRPFSTLPTASLAAARGFFLSLFWLQEYKGGRELWAR